MSKKESVYNIPLALGVGIGTFISGIYAFELPILHSIGIGVFAIVFGL